MFNDSLILQAIAILLLLSNVIVDPLRDTWMSRGNDIGWWKRHLVKWGQFYPPLIFIGIVHVNPWLWLPILLIAAALWQVSLIKIAKVDWGGSKWLKILKRSE